jgi:HAE1 family hydrophobic/amphiphilic exporter-1
VFVPVFYAVIEQLRERGGKSEPVAKPTEPTAEPAFERLAEAAE